MKKYIGVVFLITLLIGCYKQAPLERVVPVEIKVIDMDAPVPSQDEADVIITTHIKKASYLFSPRTAETPYTFTLLIDGSEIKESVKGMEEVESKIDEERGKGIHYAMKKRIRLKLGSYEISLKPEDGPSAKIKIDLSGGKIHILRFDPVYGPPKFGRPKHFHEKVVDYSVYLNEDKVVKE